MISHDYNQDEPATPNLPLVPGTVLEARYRIVRLLGRGGMGAVYEAVDQRLGKTVALKETLSAEPSMRRQFEHEARLLAGMHHSALPQVTDHFVEGSRAFLVMQFIGGVDLAKIIAQQPGPFPRDQVIAWADQLLDALIYLHSRDRQVIHRDIKPHNLKLTATGQIALLDFGLAKAQASDQSITASQAFYGYTRHYAPLEQIQDQRTDPRSDIYALGATLYHLLTGIKPPDAMVRASAVVNDGVDPLKPADQIHAAVGPQIAAILSKAMAQKPAERYATASEFREALRRMGRTKGELKIERKVAADAVAAWPAGRTVHISEVPAAYAVESQTPKLALVASSRQFGPAGATAVLAIIVALAGGILYGAQRWFPASGKEMPAAVGASTDSAAALRQSAAAVRKPERARTGENAAATAVKPKTIAEANSPVRTPEKRTDSSVTNSEKRTETVAKSTIVPGRATERAGNVTRKNSQRPGAPSIRLPTPEFRDNSPVPAPSSRLRSYTAPRPPYIVAQLRNYPSNTQPPKFFRAADGTQIVKFSDGSTRLVRPGRRNVQSSGSYR